MNARGLKKLVDKWQKQQAAQRVADKLNEQLRDEAVSFVLEQLQKLVEQQDRQQKARGSSPR